MISKPQIKFSETVVLIDAAFLNFVIKDVKGYFEKTSQRKFQKIDFSMLSMYLTLDAGIKEGGNGIQFLMVYDEASSRLFHCHPSNLRTELDGVAFQSVYGEYTFAGVPSEGVVSREELFLDLLSVIASSEEVKRLIIIPFNEEYGNKVENTLHEVKGKDIFLFRMDKPTSSLNYKWDMLAFPIMHALGITADDI